MYNKSISVKEEIYILSEKLTDNDFKEQSKHNKIKKSKADKAVMAVFYAFICVFSVVCLYPFLQVLISSFADESTLLIEGYKLIPSKFSLAAYQVIFKGDKILNSYKITIFITLVGTFLSLLIMTMAAYALSSDKMKYRNLFNFLYYFTMLFNGGVVASYLLITQYLHIDNTVWVYILPASFNVWNCFLLRSFFNDIPRPLIESAEIDGANQWIIMFKIVLPLSLPAIATIGLFQCVAFWNDWGAALLYIQDERLFTLQYQIVLLTQSIEAATKAAENGMSGILGMPPAHTVRLATAIITIGPIVLLYPFLQKYFVTGLKVGGVKG